jgi:hypothetical protein
MASPKELLWGTVISWQLVEAAPSLTQKSYLLINGLEPLAKLGGFSVTFSAGTLTGPQLGNWSRANHRNQLQKSSIKSRMQQKKLLFCGNAGGTKHSKKKIQDPFVFARSRRCNNYCFVLYATTMLMVKLGLRCLPTYFPWFCRRLLYVAVVM